VGRYSGCGNGVESGAEKSWENGKEGRKGGGGVGKG